MINFWEKVNFLKKDGIFGIFGALEMFGFIYADLMPKTELMV